MTSKLQWLALVAVAIIAFGGWFFPQTRTAFGAAVTDIQNSVYSGISVPQFFLGGNSTATSIGETVSTGSCNSGAYAASSTLFAVANPFTSTSTATMQVISGTGQATTSVMLVGTSTTSTGITSTTVSPSFMNAQVATSAAFVTNPGILSGSLGYLSPGASTIRTVSIAPGDFIVGQATSTTSGMGTNYSPGLTCAYKIRWTN
jgi:hypothetical protein